MSSALTVQALFDQMQEPLQLRWLHGQSGGDRRIHRDTDNDKTNGDDDSGRPNLLGLLNLLSPNRIQLLGRTEIDALAQSDQMQQQMTFEQLFQPDCVLIVMADGAELPAGLRDLAKISSTAVLQSPLPINSLINRLGQFLTRQLSETRVIHGVLMEVLGIGVLITGDSSVGKSELALELVSRGHTLVADDAPEFRKIAHNRIEGSCPELLRNFLEVRGLGILNIQRMYGHASTRHHKILRLIVHLELMDESTRAAVVDRLRVPERSRNVLGVEISELTIPVAPGRNLAVLVEAAVRNYLLHGEGYDSAADFEQRHQQMMDAAQCNS